MVAQEQITLLPARVCDASCRGDTKRGYSPSTSSVTQAELKKPEHDYLGPAGISPNDAVNARRLAIPIIVRR